MLRSLAVAVVTALNLLAGELAERLIGPEDECRHDVGEVVSYPRGPRRGGEPIRTILVDRFTGAALRRPLARDDIALAGEQGDETAIAGVSGDVLRTLASRGGTAALLAALATPRSPSGSP